MQTLDSDAPNAAFTGEIRTWDPQTAKEAYESNDVVKSVEATQKPSVSKQLEHEVDAVIGQVLENTTLEAGQWKVGQHGMDAVDRLRNSLLRHAHGSKLDIQTLMYSEKLGEARYTDRAAVVSECLRGLASPDQDLKDVDASNAAKVASRSMARPWGDMAELRLGAFSDNSLPLACNEEALKKAVLAVQHLLPARSLTPAPLSMAFDAKGLSAEDLVLYNLKEGYTPMVTTTSSGPPYFLPAWYPSTALKEKNASLYETVAMAFDDILGNVKRLRADCSKGLIDSHTFWGQLNFRTNDPKGEGDPDLKATRLVFGAPKWFAILAKTYTIPINNALKKVRFFNGTAPFAPMMGSKYTDAHVHNLLSKATKSGRTLLCGDMSHFDNSKVQKISMMVAEAVASWFRHEDARKAIYWQMYIEYHKACMAVPDRWVSPRPIGQASGSGFTLMMNSLMLLVFLFYGYYDGYWDFEGAIVQGDDYVADLPGANPETAELVAAKLGLEANASKQYFQLGRAEFLRCIHKAEHPGGYASISRTIGNMTAPEKRVSLQSRDERLAYETVRAISQLHNIEFRSEFEQVVDFVKQYDSQRLFEDKTFEEIVSASGDAGRELLAEESREGRKQVSSVPAKDWLVNRVREGNKIPAPEKRYPYVYGESFDSVISSGNELQIKSNNYLKDYT